VKVNGMMRTFFILCWWDVKQWVRRRQAARELRRFERTVRRRTVELLEQSRSVIIL
jgi:hypothetical protein